MTARRTDIAGVVLAGGRSRRMGGGDKALLQAGGQTLLARTIAALRPQVGPLVLSSGSEAIRRAAAALPAVADPLPDCAGPLAGILAALEWLRESAPACRWLVSVPVDAPLFPGDLVTRLTAAAEEGGYDLACARSGGRHHPVFALWPLSLTDALRRAVLEDGVRRVDRWTAGYRLVAVEWSAHPQDPFHNVNTPEELAHLTAILAD